MTITPKKKKTASKKDIDAAHAVALSLKQQTEQTFMLMVHVANITIHPDESMDNTVNYIQEHAGMYVAEWLNRFVPRKDDKDRSINLTVESCDVDLIEQKETTKTDKKDKK